MSAKTMPIALAAFVALGFAAGAHAGPNDATVSVRVQTAGLDLGSERGAGIALNRVRHAADQICGGRPDPRALREMTTYRACLRTTVDTAVASVNAPVLAALNGSQQPAAVLAAATR